MIEDIYIRDREYPDADCFVLDKAMKLTVVKANRNYDKDILFIDFLHTDKRFSAGTYMNVAELIPAGAKIGDHTLGDTERKLATSIEVDLDEMIDALQMLKKHGS